MHIQEPECKNHRSLLFPFSRKGKFSANWELNLWEAEIESSIYVSCRWFWTKTVESPSRFSCQVSTIKGPPDLQGLSRPDRESTTTAVDSGRRKQCTTIHLIKHIIDKNEKDEYRHSEFLAPDNLMLSAGLLSWCLSLIIHIQPHVQEKVITEWPGIEGARTSTVTWSVELYTKNK